MSGLPAEEQAAAPVAQEPQYSVLKQKVDLDIDFATRTLKGSTELTVQPHVKILREIHLHCRQCRPTSIQAGGIAVRDFTYDDPYRRVTRLPQNSDVHQHDMLKRKIEASLRNEEELVLQLPAKLKIQELQVDPATALPQYRDGVTPSLQKQESDAMAMIESQQTAANAHPAGLGPQFAPLKLLIEFEVDDFRDGLHWIGFEEGLDARYPHCYSVADWTPGSSSCIFPCKDDRTSRCSWEISIRCARTLGDAFKKPIQAIDTLPEPVARDATKANGDIEMTNGGNDSIPAPAVKPPQHAMDKYYLGLTEEEAGMDLMILCTGELADDAADAEDDTRHTLTFNITNPVCARHIGFAIGPFESVDLSAFREVDEEERLGQSAVKVTGYCLPGRSDEVRNTAFPLTQCIDFYGVNFGSSPFATYEILFVDDLVADTAPLAGFTFASTRLLFPEDIIEPLDRNTRLLTRAVADQWMGVNVIPASTNDEWVVAGVAGYMNDLFMKKLAGNNSYRWQQKMAAEKVYEVDFERPGLHELGRWLHIDSTVREFLDLKSALVLFILDRRLMKASGATGVTRIINRILLQAKTGALVNGEISTLDFQRICERLGHNKLESFFKQWVFGAGCPIFFIQQRFNKKKLVVEMTISQRQMERKTKPPFTPDNFMREVKEHVQEVWAAPTQTVFTGPMTIRIHEADGTPYEHIVEIKEPLTKLEIPYNTKYKRLKRSRRQKERAIATGDSGAGGDGADGTDSLLYCLGDILDSQQEMQDWKLIEWTPEEEEKMGQESYEWIRIDADFEWIGKIHLVMPLYMYISQLQQDRDLVAQYESMRFLLGSNPHQMSLTILVRTLMDHRYFWGIRQMAADGIAILAKQFGTVDLRGVGMHQLERAFAELYCFENSAMPRPNDFSDRVSFIIQCAIPRAMAMLRDSDGKVPMGIRRFFADKLKFNDNSSNEFSDAHYVATLMTCLADSLVASHREPQPTYDFSFGEEEAMDAEMADDPDKEFEREAIAEIERYRRIDEWISTYQNIYSNTALNCLQKLTNAGIVKNKTPEVLQYTRATNAENVRLQAFRCLAETGHTRRMTVMRYLLHSLAEDPSPSCRDGLMKCFGKALGHIALGDAEAADKAAEAAIPAAANDGLVLEGEVNSEAKHLDVIRKSGAEGAIVALKAVFGNDAVFKQALWWAATSPMLTINELGAFTEVAALMFDSVSSYSLALKLPRVWACQTVGKGKVRFYQHGPYRTRPIKELALEDWEELQKLRLSYSGPLSKVVVAAVKSAKDQESMRILQLQIDQAERLQAEQKAAERRPSAEMSAPSIPAPTLEHKPSFKLNLAKRKQSMSEPQREGNPKIVKTSKQQTPNGLTPAPQPKRSPSVASSKGGARRSSIPAGTNASPRRSKMVALKLSHGAMRRAQEIQAIPPKNGVKARSESVANGYSQASRSITPSLQHQPSSMTSQSYLQSPTGLNGGTNGLTTLYSPSGSFSGSPLNLNVGGFRTYGPAPDSAPALPVIKQEGHESASPLTDVAAMSSSPAPLPPPAQSQTAPSGTLDASMPPPKSKKITLKLTRKPSSGGAPSPQQ